MNSEGKTRRESETVTCAYQYSNPRYLVDAYNANNSSPGSRGRFASDGPWRAARNPPYYSYPRVNSFAQPTIGFNQKRSDPVQSKLAWPVRASDWRHRCARFLELQQKGFLPRSIFSHSREVSFNIAGFQTIGHVFGQLLPEQESAHQLIVYCASTQGFPLVSWAQFFSVCKLGS